PLCAEAVLRPATAQRQRGVKASARASVRRAWDSARRRPAGGWGSRRGRPEASTRRRPSPRPRTHGSPAAIRVSRRPRWPRPQGGTHPRLPALPVTRSQARDDPCTIAQQAGVGSRAALGCGRGSIWVCARPGSRPQQPARSPEVHYGFTPFTFRRRTRSVIPATTRTRPQPPRRPCRWGRLLVLGVTLALVATLGTRALAADPDGLSFESPDEQTDQPTQGDPNDNTASVTPLELNQPPTVVAQAEPTGEQVPAPGQQQGDTIEGTTGQAQPDQPSSTP